MDATPTRPLTLAEAEKAVARQALAELSEPALLILATACQLGQVARAIAIDVLDELDGLVKPDARGRWVVPTDEGLALVIAAL